MGRKTHTFDSKAQWRWAFATKKPWARRWAEATEASGKEAVLPKRRKPPTSAYRTARSLLGR